MRRKAIHEEQYQSSHSTLCFINRYIEDLSLIPQKKHSVQQVSERANLQAKKWLPPRYGWAKANLDAAISRNAERGAVAAVCRDYTGLFLGASAMVVDNLQPETLEALDCSEGLSLAPDINLQKVQISTDCMATVNHIGDPFLGPSKVIMEEIKMKLQVLPESDVIHERRDHNFEAHVVAKVATTLGPGRHLWLTGTPDIFFGTNPRHNLYSHDC